MEGDVELKQVSRIHAIMAERMVKSWSEAPQFYLSMEVNLDPALKVKRKLDSQGVNASLTDLIVFAVARALAQFPQLNAYWDNGAIRQGKSTNVGIAVAKGEEIVVVVVQDADRKSIQELVAETQGLVTRARTGRFTLDDISGGTLTVSNLGMFGVDRFTAILNPPEACILAVGRGTRRPVLAQGGLAEMTVASFTLTTDHRVATGVTSAKFLGAVRSNMENIEKLIEAQCI
jgi:pyruvate dehydrogenase E2 component (dihydrolipoamide acetyltransferase)